MKGDGNGGVDGLADDIHGQGRKTSPLYQHCLADSQTLRLTSAAVTGSPGIFFSFAEAVVHRHVTCCSLLGRLVDNLQDMRRFGERDLVRRDSQDYDCAGGMESLLGGEVL
jgi:hypothetical protein